MHSCCLYLGFYLMFTFGMMACQRVLFPLKFAILGKKIQFDSAYT